MKNRLANLFIFTKSERNGVIGLITLILLVVLFRFSFQSLAQTKEHDYSEIVNVLANLKATQDTIQTYPSNTFVKYNNTDRGYKQNARAKAKSNTPKQIIDPNNASIQDWKQLGFSQKQAQAILNYTSNGVVYREKKDLLKLFVIDDRKLAEIEQFIEIKKNPEQLVNQTKKQKPKFERRESKFEKKPRLKKYSVEVNSADTSMLKQISGIGPYYAKSIVKYRAIMGGIISKDQYSEIYGLQENQNSIDSLIKYTWIDKGAIVKININNCTYKDLAGNRYISYSIAKAIVSYREMHGDFETLSDMANSDLVSDELVSKIAPYLKLNDN